MQMTKKTSLEVSKDIKDTLDWKIKTIEAKKLPTETAIADYIALGIQNLDNKLEYIKNTKAELDKDAKTIKNQIEHIKIEGAKFLKDAGIEKLDGLICSSITLTNEKKETEEYTKKLVFTPLISQAEIEELLIGLGKAEMREVVETKTTNYIPPKLKINPRRK